MGGIAGSLFFIFLLSGWKGVASDYVVFKDNFERPTFFPANIWMQNPYHNYTFATIVEDSSIGSRVLTFTNATLVGDIYTANLLLSPTGRYRVSLDYWGEAGATSAYLGWALDFESVPDWIAWFGLGEADYVTASPASTAIDYLVFPSNGSWVHLEQEIGIGIIPAASIVTPQELVLDYGVRFTFEKFTGNGYYNSTGDFRIDNFKVEAIEQANSSVVTAPLSDQVQVHFAGDNPNFRLVPVNNSTTDVLTFVRFDQLVEVVDTSDNSQVLLTCNIPPRGFTLQQPDSQHLNYNHKQLANTSISVGVNFTLVSQAQTLDYAGRNMSISADTLKYSLQVHDWSFSVNHSNSLLRYTTGINVQSIDPSTGTTSNSEEYLLLEINEDQVEDITRYLLNATASQMVLRLSFSNRVVVDGQSTDVIAAHLLVAGSLSFAPAQIGDTVDRVIIFFPHFNYSLVYDPDLSLLIAQDDMQDESDGGNDPDYLWLLFILAIPVAVAVIVGFIIGGIVVRKCAIMRQVKEKDLVNFGDDL